MKNAQRKVEVKKGDLNNLKVEKENEIEVEEIEEKKLSEFQCLANESITLKLGKRNCFKQKFPLLKI
jgi:hypothetical protein